jgi:hypothetical protein
MEHEQQLNEQSELRNQIDAAIAEAVILGQPVDDLTAKQIAVAIHPGSGPLYDFATTGEVSDGTFAELDVGREVLPELADTWIAALEGYCQSRQYPGKVPGWQSLATSAETARMSDDDLIRYHITEALREQRPIDHATTRAIASQLHGGQASALYALASSGALVDGLPQELDSWRHSTTPVELEPWLDALDEYLDTREDNPDAVDGWQALWPARPESDDAAPTVTEPLATDESEAVPTTVPTGEAPPADIPTLHPHHDCDGYGWIERLPAGWKAVPSWGRDGWDLAAWPLMVVATYEDDQTEQYALGVYTEGDITVMHFPTKAFLYDALDDVAEWYWRKGYARGPATCRSDRGYLATTAGRSVGNGSMRKQWAMSVAISHGSAGWLLASCRRLGQGS